MQKRSLWHCYAMVFAATSVIVGVNWDISWHISIGRDSFWSPPHLAIYLGGVLAGIASGFVVLRTTFRGTAQEKAESVRVWGFRGPLGAWAAIWGAFAMIVSAPFDDWWHNAYGLDVEIISPPHVVLALGITAIVYGAVLVLAARQNADDSDRQIRYLYVYACGVLILHVATFLTEYIYANLMHGGFFYIVTCAVFPFLLTGLARASRLRWPATAMSAAYMLLMLVLGWALQLAPATPKLAPIYNRIDHLVPLGFPLLLIVPGVAIDLLRRRLHGRNDHLVALVVAIAFVAVFLATQWTFAIFMLSPAADNPVFMGNRMWPYDAKPGSWMVEYWDLDTDPLNAKSLAIALLLSIVFTRLALWRGSWLSRVVR